MKKWIEFYNQKQAKSAPSIAGQKVVLLGEERMMHAHFDKYLHAISDAERRRIWEFIQSEISDYDKHIEHLGFCEKIRSYAIVKDEEECEEYIIGYATKEGLKNYYNTIEDKWWRYTVAEVYDENIYNITAEAETQYVMLDTPIHVLDIDIPVTISTRWELIKFSDNYRNIE